MATVKDPAKTIAILGGGVSGALTAWHLIQQRPYKSSGERIVIIDPRPAPGLGLAYSTPSLCHLLNVPAGKISALPRQPDHFLFWLRAHHDPDATSATFAPRAVFGRYIQSLLATAAGLEHVRAEVVGYRSSKGSAVLALGDGREIEAALVVLATGNFDPSPLPGISASAIRTGVYAHNAWEAATCVGLGPNAPVALIGSGLTAIDVLLRLRELGHRGTITAISRHGVLPGAHAPYAPAPRPAIPADTPRSCIAYLRALRQAIASGVEWRAAVDSLRPVTNNLWLALPRREQLRFRRHLQRRWDVVRHRMAPSIAVIIASELAAGTFVLRTGSLKRVEESKGAAIVTFHKGVAVHTLHAARVINCTGPAMDYRRVPSPLLLSLFAQGIATPGPLGTGLHSTRSGALIDAQGEASEILFNLGPGRLGTLIESIAIPEIREQAVELAAILTGRLKQHAQRAVNETLQLQPVS